MKRFFLLLMAVCAWAVSGYAQTPPPAEKPTEKTIVVVEKMPEYVGGQAALAKFLQSNIVYPAEAKKLGIEGKVYLNFVIDEQGNVTNVKLLRGIGGGCDEEAIRVVKLMPKWIPGEQAGKPVKVMFNLPIAFKLDMAPARTPEEKKVGQPYSRHKTKKRT